jgi:hypothetical protein
MANMILKMAFLPKELSLPPHRIGSHGDCQLVLSRFSPTPPVQAPASVCSAEKKSTNTLEIIWRWRSQPQPGAAFFPDYGQTRSNPVKIGAAPGSVQNTLKGLLVYLWKK